MSRFKGKVALVTGAGSTRGIGRGVALALAREGASLAVTDVDAVGLQKVVAELAELGPVFGHAADIRHPAEIKGVIERAVGELGGLHILVNIAGVARSTEFLDITEEEYDLLLDINLKGTFFMSQLAAREMIKSGGGIIISLASVAGQRGGGLFGTAHYTASKAGIIGLTKALARELAPHHIRVNCIAPGMIDTDILAGLSPELKAELAATTLIGRAGTVEDVANSVIFLASDESSYMSGITLDLNGGIHLH